MGPGELKSPTRSQKESYSSQEVCELLGISYRQLVYIMEGDEVPGLVRRGSGYPVRFTKLQVDAVRRLHAEHEKNNWKPPSSNHPNAIRDRAYRRALRKLRGRHIQEFDSIFERELGHEYAKENSE